MSAAKPRNNGARQRAPAFDHYMPPSSQTQVMAVLETKVDALVRQGHDTNETLRSLTRAVTQLAVIEERQTADRQAVDRAFAEISSTKTMVDALDRSVDDRIKALEKKSPINELTSGFVVKVIGLIVTAVVGGLLTLVITRPQTPPVVIQQQPQIQQAPYQKR